MENPPELNREGLVAAALDIAGDRGLAAVTMRALASRFDVTPMALYRHVADRDELIRLAVDRVGGLVRAPSAHDATWEQRARSWARAQRDVLRRYPGVAAWLVANGPAGPHAYRLLELLASALADAGFDDARVARGTALIMSWTFTRIAVEDDADPRVQARQPDRAQSFVAGLGEIDADTHPTTARIGTEFFTLPMREIFETGLDWIIAGLKSEPTRPS